MFRTIVSRNGPIKIGEEYEVKIEDTSKEGDGMTRVQDFLVFVPDTAIGDEVKVRIKSVSKNYAVAEKVAE